MGVSDMYANRRGAHATFFAFAPTVHKIWMGEEYGMSVFDAAALAEHVLSCKQSVTPSSPVWKEMRRAFG